MPANIVASIQQRKSALQTPFVCSVEKLRCSAPVRITPCHSARLTLKGSRAVATGGAFRAAGRRTRGKGSLFVFAPAGRWTAILRPAGAGGLRRLLFHGFRSPLANSTRGYNRRPRRGRTQEVSTESGPNGGGFYKVAAKHRRISTTQIRSTFLPRLAANAELWAAQSGCMIGPDA